MYPQVLVILQDCGRWVWFIIVTVTEMHWRGKVNCGEFKPLFLFFYLTRMGEGFKYYFGMREGTKWLHM